MENAAQSGHTEVEGSKLAQQKATNADIKAFTQQMVADHTKANNELVALSKKKGYTPPDTPSVVQRTKLKALSAMEGARFDKTYASQTGVSVHEDAVKLFQDASQNATDPDIKAYVAKTIPILEHHLEIAKALKQKVDQERK